MASALTDWGVTQFLGICLGQLSPPTQFYVALCFDDPGTDTDGTVLVDNEPDPTLGYARVAIGTGPSFTDTDGVPYSTNQSDIVFPTPSGSWGTCTHFALCSAAVAGEVYIYGEFDIPPAPDSDTPFTIPAGGVVITFASSEPSIVTS